MVSKMFSSIKQTEMELSKIAFLEWFPKYLTVLTSWYFWTGRLSDFAAQWEKCESPLASHATGQPHTKHSQTAQLTTHKIVYT